MMQTDEESSENLMKISKETVYCLNSRIFYFNYKNELVTNRWAIYQAGILYGVLKPYNARCYMVIIKVWKLWFTLTIHGIYMELLVLYSTKQLCFQYTW